MPFLTPARRRLYCSLFSRAAIRGTVVFPRRSAPLGFLLNPNGRTEGRGQVFTFSFLPLDLILQIGPTGCIAGKVRMFGYGVTFLFFPGAGGRAAGRAEEQRT